MTFCQVCFTGADTAARLSLNAGIGVLLAITAVVLALFARFFLSLARRSREAAHLVELKEFGAGVHEEAVR
jgi:maltodextrin utilization protein YvdJ